ncbi:hypothetical protein CIRMBP1229_02166 [Enterococcus cecorum]|uniref:hypothetical protein n=1 Tax=Enterococcus cecorum TaxID=44008 RepID=UPI0022D11CB6|nr:hypothetical protein [Enterococcus cecorum]CAI3317535.1 hypothetical protein CIRMBP1228_00850 [Enterococcus cecorum]CAI3428032.1 hypothetical protein CIRMBP1216_01840 [Enterococcus cecorum]CAI3436277.1 hypothetical protein CIRMBP1221_01857 [Enterococcus cecorum]CAI3447998.1 hypothetical protein CIRMBP1218_01926 [Enterococcus cecorum]CAI3448224.1 hypothetical protein CIRMBP1224_01945 [Enterococcus cecorum]
MELRAELEKINLTSKASKLILEIADDTLGEKLTELQELIGKDVTIQIRPTNVQGTIWVGDDKNEK